MAYKRHSLLMYDLDVIGGDLRRAATRSTEICGPWQCRRDVKKDILQE